MNTFLQIGQLIEPAPVRFSFAAPGWYAVGVLLLLVLLMVCGLIWRHYRKNRYRREAIAWLKSETSRLVAQEKYREAIYEADILMKRIAVLRYGRNSVAALEDTRWMDFLNKTGKSDFSQTEAQQLRLLYRPGDPVDPKNVLIFCRKAQHWIRSHTPSCPADLLQADHS